MQSSRFYLDFFKGNSHDVITLLGWESQWRHYFVVSIIDYSFLGRFPYLVEMINQICTDLFVFIELLKAGLGRQQNDTNRSGWPTPAANRTLIHVGPTSSWIRRQSSWIRREREIRTAVMAQILVYFTGIPPSTVVVVARHFVFVVGDSSQWKGLFSILTATRNSDIFYFFAHRIIIDTHTV